MRGSPSFSGTQTDRAGLPPRPGRVNSHTGDRSASRHWPAIGSRPSATMSRSDGPCTRAGHRLPGKVQERPSRSRIRLLRIGGAIHGLRGNRDRPCRHRGRAKRAYIGGGPQSLLLRWAACPPLPVTAVAGNLPLPPQSSAMQESIVRAGRRDEVSLDGFVRKA